MSLSSDHTHDLNILEQIEQNPGATQASLAAQLGVAVGTINWHLKRLASKGYIKVRRAERRKLMYLITPDGLSLRARLTLDYIQSSLSLYRLVRQRMMEALDQVHQAGFGQVRLMGEGDVADICRLSCLERGIEVVNQDTAPEMEIRGLKIFIDWPEKVKHG